MPIFQDETFIRELEDESHHRDKPHDTKTTSGFTATMAATVPATTLGLTILLQWAVYQTTARGLRRWTSIYQACVQKRSIQQPQVESWMTIIYLRLTNQKKHCPRRYTKKLNYISLANLELKEMKSSVLTQRAFKISQKIETSFLVHIPHQACIEITLFDCSFLKL